MQTTRISSFHDLISIFNVPEARKSQSIPTVLMGRPPCCSDENGRVLKKGPWTPEEDQMLVNYINQHGHGSWRSLPKRAGLNRCGKSCRLRWTNYLRPDIKRGKFSSDEEQTILNLHSILGNKWSAIAGHLPGRTDNEIKNFWNTHLKKKLIQMGFDPMTHQTRTDIFSTLPHLIALASLKEMIDRRQWDDQVQSDAAQIGKLQQLQHYLSSSPATESGLMLEPTNLTINSNQRMTMVMNGSSSNTPPLQTQIPDLTEIQIQPMMTINEANDQGCSSSILPNLTDISAASCSSNSGSGISSVSGITTTTTTTTFWPDEFFLDVGDQTFMSAGFP